MNTRFATRIGLLALTLVVLAAWQQGGTRSRGTTWEYMCSEFQNSRINDRISEVGRNGWEMVGFEREGTMTRFCFKRAR